MVRLPEALRRISTPWPRCASPFRIRRTAASRAHRRPAARRCHRRPSGLHSPGGGGAARGRRRPNQISRETANAALWCRPISASRLRLICGRRPAADRRPGLAPIGSWLDSGGQFESGRRPAPPEPGGPLCFFLIFLLLFSAFNSVKYAMLVFTGVPLALTGGFCPCGCATCRFRSPPPSVSCPVRRRRAERAGDGHLHQPAPSARGRTGRGHRAGRHDPVAAVLMTALVASLGFVPMALATGTGAEVQKPLATVVIGGLVSSTLLTLVVRRPCIASSPGSTTSRRVTRKTLHRNPRWTECGPTGHKS